MLVIVCERPVDCGNAQVVSVRAALWVVASPLDFVVYLQDADSSPLDAGLPSKDVRVGDNPRAALDHTSQSFAFLYKERAGYFAEWALWRQEERRTRESREEQPSPTRCPYILNCSRDKMTYEQR